MEEIIESLRPISRCLDRVQSVLALDFLNGRLVDVDGPQKSLGRVGILSCFLGTLLGIHVSAGCGLLWFSSTFPFFFSPRRAAEIVAWCLYVSAMCTFHLMEFFVTAFYNPTVVASDSFLVNHSKAYTVASIIAGTEFWLGFWCGGGGGEGIDDDAPSNATESGWWWVTTIVGIVMVVFSQTMRSRAMMKCGESFNHYIQTERKENHVLVTDGIYTWFRHPSYTGFYYWSIGTQVVLHNPWSAILFAVAGWKFFSQRIPYEERSLLRLFGDQYYDYVGRTYVGIPFVPSIPNRKEGAVGIGSASHQKEEHRTEEAIEIEVEAEKADREKKND
ncbi:unnamed protein product [Pseudo-nitzschia multistriata]|uniref:Protein-S-isoprenylcysteine O-methyltransferase n=1 Tax=Pseudo-nitzschia multistriata TaxID=183589 RepID=A0A448ZLD5_9STRA|nr:unnamed protein product [Pseudo-nitzschia multistriata]